MMRCGVCEFYSPVIRASIHWNPSIPAPCNEDGPVLTPGNKTTPLIRDYVTINIYLLVDGLMLMPEWTCVGNRLDVRKLSWERGEWQ